MRRTILLLGLVLVLLLSAVNVVTAQESVQPPYLGLTFAEHEGGVIVTRVIPDSPAADAGIKVGDVITAVDDDGITFESFADVIGSHAIGDSLSFALLRDEETVQLEVVLGKQPDTDAFQSPLPMDAFAFVQNGDEQIWQVRSLTENHPLYEAGLRAGDTITEFDGEIYSPGELREFLSGLEADEMVTVTVERDGEEMSVDVPASSLETTRRASRLKTLPSASDCIPITPRRCSARRSAPRLTRSSRGIVSLMPSASSSRPTRPATRS